MVPFQQQPGFHGLHQFPNSFNKSGLWYGGQASENQPITSGRFPQAPPPAFWTESAAAPVNTLMCKTKAAACPPTWSPCCRRNFGLGHLVSEGLSLGFIWEEGILAIVFWGVQAAVSETPLSYLHGTPPSTSGFYSAPASSLKPRNSLAWFPSCTST